MPFEISLGFTKTPARVGRFQRYAEALLRGCELTRPAYGTMYDESFPAWLPFFKPSACAVGAMHLGLGMADPSAELADEDERRMRRAYSRVYGNGIMFDNDSGAFTREQIAARIAAL